MSLAKLVSAKSTPGYPLDVVLYYAHVIQETFPH